MNPYKSMLFSTVAAPAYRRRGGCNLPEAAYPLLNKDGWAGARTVPGAYTRGYAANTVVVVVLLLLLLLLLVVVVVVVVVVAMVVVVAIVTTIATTTTTN